MSIFDSIGSLTKAVIGVVVTPVDVVADIVTLGGALTDKDKPYTVQRLQDAMKNLNDVTKP